MKFTLDKRSLHNRSLHNRGHFITGHFITDVDNKTLIQEALSKLIKNKTVLIIAHRMRTVAKSDKIVVLKDGVVAEEGTHENLDANGGIYHHMLETQMKSMEWKF